MAALGSSSSMVGDNKIGAKAVFLMMWIGYFLITVAAAIPRAELDDVLPVLRSGYNRFGIAIKTSDLIKDCVALDNLTIFAPADESMEMAPISGDSGLRSHAVHRRLPSHSLSITVRGTRRTVHIAVNGVPLESPGLYHSSHGLAGDLIPLSHFPSCCLQQSPIRAKLVETPSLSAYAGPLPPRPPDTSIGFSISSTAAAITAATIAAGVIIHLFRPRHNSAPIDDDPPHHFAPLDNDTDGIVLILQMIINTLRWQGIYFVRINDGPVLRVSPEQLGVRLRRYYESRLQILTQPQYARYRTPDEVIMVVDMADESTLHLGRVLRYFVNSPVYDTAFVVSITAVGSPVGGGGLGRLPPLY